VGHHGARHLSPLLPRRLIKRDRKGGYSVNLGAEDREVLRQVVPQFRELLENPDQPALYRLFPPAYSETAHSELQDEYRRLMQEDLVERHREEFDVVAATADAEHLSDEQLQAWTRALNSVRLVLGTVLDIQEGDEERVPGRPEESLYQWLTFLQGEAIEALAGEL
jgi:Domain of unknown function (DUF2017)